MKLLIKKTDQNQRLLMREYEIMRQLRDTEMTEDTFNILSTIIQPIYSLQDINTKIIKQLIPDVTDYDERKFYYFMPIYSKIELK